MVQPTLKREVGGRPHGEFAREFFRRYMPPSRIPGWRKTWDEFAFVVQRLRYHALHECRDRDAAPVAVSLEALVDDPGCGDGTATLKLGHAPNTAG